MPVYYQFEKDGEFIDLIDIDKLMCEDLQIPCNPDRYCNMFQFCQIIGTSSKVQDNSGKVDKERLTTFLNAETAMTPEERALVIKYLCGEYTFSSWYQSR